MKLEMGIHQLGVVRFRNQNCLKFFDTIALGGTNTLLISEILNNFYGIMLQSASLKDS